MIGIASVRQMESKKPLGKSLYLTFNTIMESRSHNSYSFLLLLTVKDEKAKQNCYICKQSRPCCRQPLMELRERDHHEKFIHPIQGPLRYAWGLGSVWVTCCHAYYGMYYDDETTAYKPIYLGDCEEQALLRVNHVKSFLADHTGRQGYQDP